MRRVSLPQLTLGNSSWSAIVKHNMAPKLHGDEGLVDWERMTDVEVYNTWRAFDGNIGCYTLLPARWTQPTVITEEETFVSEQPGPKSRLLLRDVLPMKRANWDHAWVSQWAERSEDMVGGTVFSRYSSCACVWDM